MTDATDVMVGDVAEPTVPTGSAWVGVRKQPWHKHWVWPLSGTRDRVDNAATIQENMARIEPGVVERIITNTQMNRSNVDIFWESD